MQTEAVRKMNKHRIYATVTLGVVLSAMAIGMQMESSWSILLFAVAGWLCGTVINQTIKASTWAAAEIATAVVDAANRANR